MELNKISKEIVTEIQYRESMYKDDVKSLTKKVEDIIKKKIIDIIRPEGVYEIDKYYDGLGNYVGIIKEYPYGENYILKKHKFVEPSLDFRSSATVKEILIEKVKK